METMLVWAGLGCVFGPQGRCDTATEGCDSADVDTDDTEDTEDTEDTDDTDDTDDTNNPPPPDTGIAELAYGARWEVDLQGASPEFIEGAFGWNFIAVGPNNPGLSVCEAYGEWSVTGEGPPCEGCDWSFNLTVGTGEPEGVECDDFGVTGAEWDAFQAGWGFHGNFDFYGDGTVFVQDAVLYYSAVDSYFFALGFNYGGYDMVGGDAAQGDMIRTLGYYYYYYL